jgi:hypothetical protein
MVIDPGASQRVTWVFDSQSAYDTSTGDGWLISATNGGQVYGVYGTGSWTSTNTIGVSINADANSNVDDIHLTAHRAYNNRQQGVYIGGTNVARVFIDGGSCCNNSQQSAGLFDAIDIGGVFVYVQGANAGTCSFLAANQSRNGVGIRATGQHVSLTGNYLANNATAGVTVTQGADYISVVGNDMTLNGSGSSPPIFIPGTGHWNFIIHDNLGIDNVVPSATAAPVMVIPPNPTFSIVGTSGIQTISGSWEGRQFTMIPLALCSFGIVGNVQNSQLCQVGIPIFAVQAGGVIYLR